MKTTKQKLRSKGDKLFKERVLEIHDGICEVCGKEAITAHHFFPKGNFGHLRYTLSNGISICNTCHFGHHHRGDPRIHQTIIQNRGQKWYNELEKQAKNRPTGTYLIVSWYKDNIEKLL